MAAKGTIVKKAVGNAWKVGGSALIPAYFAANEYQIARDEGKGVVSSVARAGVDFAIGEALGWWYPVLMVSSALPSMAVSGYQVLDQVSRQTTGRNQNTPFINNRFNDTQGAYTMRQQGMQLAKASKFNLEQSLMGNEASHFNL